MNRTERLSLSFAISAVFFFGIALGHDECGHTKDWEFATAYSPYEHTTLEQEYVWAIDQWVNVTYSWGFYTYTTSERAYHIETDELLENGTILILFFDTDKYVDYKTYVEDDW